jgi:regulator of RNase E activity RraB
MSLDFPNDADGDALRRVAADGSDLSRPMSIDFTVAVPDAGAGLEVAVRAGALGYQTAVRQDEESREWTCYCTRIMVPSYEAVVAAQQELDELARSHGGWADGWGTFGNRESG